MTETQPANTAPPTLLIMGEGRAEILEDTEEKKEALSIFMKSQTGKDFVFQDKMVSVVHVIKIHVAEYTAKNEAAAAACNAESDRIEEESEHEQMYMVSI